MIPRYTPLKRTPIRKKRKKPRPGRMTAAEIGELRHECFVRDKGRCVDCGVKLVEFPVNPLQADGYHMAHRRNRKMWGDSLDNVRAKCRFCHIVIEHSGGKVVPSKAT